MTERYRLEIRAELQKVDEQGYSFGNERLSVNETIDLGSMDFLGVCKVLGQFHAVAEEIKTARND